MYIASMNNLPEATVAFSHSFIYDNSGQEVILQVQIERGKIILAETALAQWIEQRLVKIRKLHRGGADPLSQP